MAIFNSHVSLPEGTGDGFLHQHLTAIYFGASGGLSSFRTEKTTGQAWSTAAKWVNLSRPRAPGLYVL